ncbi:MAG: hypothetical protein HY606_08615 [Planctomycetes bacterium]|nr:hypothetical protein [Planctomycetota bacterium]
MLKTLMINGHKLICTDENAGLLKNFMPIQATLKDSVRVKESTYKRIYIFPRIKQNFMIKEHLRKRLFKRNKAMVEYLNSMKILEKGINITPFRGVILFDGKGYLISDYDKNCIRLSESRFSRKLVEKYAVFCKDILEKGIFQYDFNPTNVLVDNAEKLYLCDFEHIKFQRPSLGKICWVLARLSRYNGVLDHYKLIFLRKFFGDIDKNELKVRLDRILKLRKKWV